MNSTDDQHPSRGGDRTYAEPLRVRRPWRSPRLEVLGDLRGTTLGGSVIDIGDSQFPNTRP